MNGYANRATWNVALWLSNDEGIYTALRDHFRCSTPTPPRVRVFCERTFGTETPDGDKLSAVQWKEICRTVKELL